MRFSFNVENALSSGISVIPEIPGIRLARIEGKNGIGKTLAARLLEIVSGEQPFAALPRAWASLVDLLGRVEIRIDGLREGEVVVTFDSSEWAGRTQEDCSMNPGSATLGGEPVTWEHLRSLLQVRRIAGDEGLAETLARTIRTRSLEADRSRRSTGSVVDGWSINLETLQATCGESRAATLRELRVAETSARNEYERARDAYRAREDEAANWQIASSKLRSVQAIVTGAPSLLDGYEACLRDAQAASKRIDTLEQQLTDIGAAAVHDRSRRELVAKWSRLLELRDTAYTRARLQEGRVLGYLDLTSRPEASEISRLRREASQELQSAEEALQTADLAGELRNAAQEMSSRLSRLPASAAPQAIADLERPVSVQDLQSGLDKRRRFLAGVPRPGEADRIARNIQDLKDRIGVLDRLRGIIEVTDRKASNLDEARQELTSLLGLTAQEEKSRQATQQSLTEQRDTMLRRSADAVALASKIYALIGAPAPKAVPGTDATDQAIDDQDEESFDSVSAELDDAVAAILAPHHDVLTQVVDALQALIREVESLQIFDDLDADIPLTEPSQAVVAGWAGRAQESFNRSTALRDRAREKLQYLEVQWSTQRSALTRQRGEIANGISSLVDPEGDWTSLRPQLEGLLTRAGLTLEEASLNPDGFLEDNVDSGQTVSVEERAAVVLESISDLATAIEDSASRIRDAWGTASAYLGSVTRSMAPRLASADPEGVPFSSYGASPSASLLRQWTQAEVGSILSSGALRAQLFDGADSVTFDLDDLAVHWKTSDGRRRRRPLEAFSSGEQVFAYTKAKLETFRDLKREGTSVVIFLDEFGAFVARDRFSELMRYVGEEVIGAIADQVVVMLPSSTVDGAPTLHEELRHVYRGSGYIVTSAEPEGS